MGMNGRGFFVHNGEMIEITGSTHIRTVLNDPERFGLEKEALVALYQECNEPIGFEGKARSLILERLIRSGWVRVRQTLGRSGQWTIQFDNWAERKEQVIDFLRWAYAERVVSSDESVILNGIDDGFVRTVEIGKLDTSL